MQASRNVGQNKIKNNNKIKPFPGGNFVLKTIKQVEHIHFVLLAASFYKRKRNQQRKRNDINFGLF